MKLAPVGLRKFSDAVEKWFVKKDVYDELFKKNNVIKTADSSNLVKKAENNTNIAEV